MRNLSNGFYIIVAIVSVLWSLFSTFEIDKNPDNSIRLGKTLTEISTLELIDIEVLKKHAQEN